MDIQQDFYKIDLIAFSGNNSANSLSSGSIFTAGKCDPRFIQLEEDNRQIFGLCAVSLGGMQDSLPGIAGGGGLFYLPDPPAQN